MPFIDLGEKSLFYTKQSTAPTPSIVLIHGAAGSHLDWPPQLRRLPDTSVYAIDLPGHGRSTGPPSTTIDDFADIVLEFIVKLDLVDAVLVGHSMGGAIVQSIGLRQQARVRGLVLISSGAKLRVMDTLLDGTMTDLKATADMLADTLWAATATNELRSLGKRSFLASNPEVTRADYMACNAFDVLDQIGLIDLPTLVICGSDDNMTPLKYSRYLFEEIPGASLKIVDDGGHMVILEQPVLVANSIRDFLDEIF